MNIILFEQREIVDNFAIIGGRRAEHIVKVLRSGIEDQVTVGIINGKIGYGIIKEIKRRQPCQVKLEVWFERFPEAAPPIDILLALPRPIVFKRVVSQLTALGVNRVFVVNAAKVEKSYWESSVIVEEGWKNYVREGLEQAIDTRMVDFTYFRGFKPFMNTVLPDLKHRYAQLLMAHPHQTSPLAERFEAGGAPVLIAIGPEGGWNGYELEMMEKHGFSAFSLGTRILKVETAVTAIVACVKMLQGS
jgi:16S rRNA (uracil1498-N3)-methyltransferase